jgi:hypothetical protein
MKPSNKFDRQLIDIYIQEVSNLISIYPMMFTVDNGGTTPKKITKAFLEGIYPLPFRQVVTDKGPETLKSAINTIYVEYDKFANYNEILALQPTTATPPSSEGKIADVAIKITSITNFFTKKFFQIANYQNIVMLKTVYNSVCCARV